MRHYIIQTALLWIGVLTIQSLDSAKADPLAIAIASDSAVTVALVSADGEREHIIEASPLSSETLATRLIPKDVSPDGRTLLYQLEQINGTVRIFTDKLQTLPAGMGLPFLIDNGVRAVLSRIDYASSYSTGMPRVNWYIYDIQSHDSKDLPFGEDMIIGLHPWFGSKLIASKFVPALGLSGEPMLFDLKSQKALPFPSKKIALQARPVMSPDGRRAILSEIARCSLGLVSGDALEEVSLPKEDFYCNDIRWISNDEILYSGSPAGGSTYGAAYSVRKFNLRSHESTTLIKSDQHLFYYLLGVLRDGRLVVLSHGVDRSPKFALEIADANGGNRKSLFASEREIAFLGELFGTAATLKAIEPTSPLAKLRMALGAAKTDDDSIRNASHLLMASGARPFPSSFYPTIEVAARSRDGEVRKRVISELQGMVLADTKKVEIYRRLVSDPDRQVQASAIRALAALGEKAKGAADELLAVIEKDGDLFNRVLAIEALPKIERSEKTARAILVAGAILPQLRSNLYDSRTLLQGIANFGKFAAPLGPRLASLVKGIKIPQSCNDIRGSGDDPKILDAATASESPEAAAAVKQYVEQFTPLLTRCLFDNDQYAREHNTHEVIYYVEALRRYGDVFVPLLAKALKEPDIDNGMISSIRKTRLVEGLTRIDTPAAKQVLAAQVKELAEELKHSAAPRDVLCEIGIFGSAADAAIPAIVDLVRSKSEASDSAIPVLGSIGTSAATAALLKLSEGSQWRPEILTALAKHTVPAFQANVLGRYLRVRGSSRDTAELLARSASQEEREMLIGNDQFGILQNAGESSVPQYTDYRKLEIEKVARWQKCVKETPKRCPILASIFSTLDDGEPFFFSHEATSAFGRVGFVTGKSGVALLMKELDGDPNVASYAAAALGFTGRAGRAAIPELLKRAQAGDSWTRAWAVRALGPFARRSTEARETLEMYSADGDASVKSTAEQQLKLLQEGEI